MDLILGDSENKRNGYVILFAELITGMGVYQLFSRGKRLGLSHFVFGYLIGSYLFTQIIFIDDCYNI
jgi:hypothetical protein|tara:strand:- start:128 stop:328 length:201 start_codon:yes stop_codon:yes gene_type:complete